MLNGFANDMNDLTGWVILTLSRTLIGGWLAADGSAVSRSTFSRLFTILCPSATVTMTIASPAVITWTAHQLNIGDIVVFTTTGALPTGITAGKQYYVLSTTTNTFQIALTDGGAAIITTGTQSGVHTAQIFTYGIGNGTTTFNLPDLRGRAGIGSGTGTKNILIVSVASNIITAFGLRANNNEFQTGNAVVFTAVTAGNLVNGTTYYVNRQSNTSFKLCNTLADAQNGANFITLAGTETGMFTLTLSPRTLGDTLGEENHAMSLQDLIAHFHGGLPIDSNQVLGGSGSHTAVYVSSQNSGTTGGNQGMNVMQPSFVGNWIIHI